MSTHEAFAVALEEMRADRDGNGSHDGAENAAPLSSVGVRAVAIWEINGSAWPRTQRNGSPKASSSKKPLPLKKTCGYAKRQCIQIAVQRMAAPFSKSTRQIDLKDSAAAACPCRDQKIAMLSLGEIDHHEIALRAAA